MPSVEERLAKNEVMFRAINERIRDLAVRFNAADEPIGFICECADETCVEKVPLTLEQYEEMRVLPARFAVVPGHEATPLVERIVFRTPEFVLVRKVGIAADAVRRLYSAGEA
ncbi:MAG: hypothetical protein JO073_11515 [Actinobacteria bacterium]|nr:hypothetical protein [Actinomycetota bacterium]